MKQLRAGDILIAVERSRADDKFTDIVKSVCRMLRVPATEINMETIASFITLGD